MVEAAALAAAVVEAAVEAAAADPGISMKASVHMEYKSPDQ